MGPESPIAKIESQYSSIRNDIKNHCVKESSIPKRLEIYKGAVVMLQKNYVVEEKLTNGSVGFVREIVYKNKNGPAERGSLPEYVVVEFPNSKIPESEKLIKGKPSTYIPVPVEVGRCEKGCCLVRGTPLRVCIAITIHKSQGMTIGRGEIFEKVVVYLPENNRSSPKLELVAFSRVKTLADIAVGNMSNNLVKMDIQKLELVQKII